MGTEHVYSKIFDYFCILNDTGRSTITGQRVLNSYHIFLTTTARRYRSRSYLWYMVFNHRDRSVSATRILFILDDGINSPSNFLRSIGTAQIRCDRRTTLDNRHQMLEFLRTTVPLSEFIDAEKLTPCSVRTKGSNESVKATQRSRSLIPPGFAHLPRSGDVQRKAYRTTNSPIIGP